MRSVGPDRDPRRRRSRSATSGEQDRPDDAGPGARSGRSGGNSPCRSSAEASASTGSECFTVKEIAAEPPEGRTGAMIPGASRLARHVRGVRATMPSDGDTARLLARARSAALVGGRRRSASAGDRGRDAGRGARAGPCRAADGGVAAARLDVRAAADARHRRRRRCGGGGRSGASTPRIPPIPCRFAGPWRSRPGLPALAFALLSGIDRYDTTLFSVHMVQHVLLTLVAAPLIALAAPDHAASLRLASPRRGAAGSCRSCIRASTRILAFPVVAWVIFAGVMWVSHFSPLFDAALEDPLVHDLEHALFLGSAPAVLVAGGRAGPGAVADAAPGARPVRASSRCRRTRSSPSCSSTRRPCSIRITRRSCGPGARPPWRTSRPRPGSCGWPATPSSSPRSWRSSPAGCGPRLATRGGRTAGRPRRWPTSGSASGLLAERLAREREDGQPGSGVSR